MQTIVDHLRESEIILLEGTYLEEAQDNDDSLLVMCLSRYKLLCLMMQSTLKHWKTILKHLVLIQVPYSFQCGICSGPQL